MIHRSLVVLFLVVFAFGCDETVTPDAGGTDAGGADSGRADAGARDAGVLVVPDTYAFDSRFTPGTDSVRHRGQTARQVLIADLAARVGGFDAEITGGALSPSADGDITSILSYYFSIDGAERASDPFLLSTTPMSLQTTYGDLSDVARLEVKVAGNDAVTDHQDWSTAFRGWTDAAIAANGGGVTSPSLLVQAIFELVEENAIQRSTGGTPRLSPAGVALPVHVTESGIDLEQLLETFLLGAINFSQGADDYLDDETDDDSKGLLADNTAPDGTNPATPLERAWDEAYGYFGASRFYGMRDAAAIAAGPSADRDGDSRIDLTREHDFSAAVQAAERDASSASSAPTSYVTQAWTAFRTGRAIITHSAADLDSSAELLASVQAQRDLALEAWEAAVAATVVHHLNQTLTVMANYETAFSHDEMLILAGAWSQMKGLALMFQFNRRSPMSAQFEAFHAALGDRPVLPAEGATGVADYRVSLRAARTMLGTAYGFDAANLGDADGMNGW